MNVSPQVDAPPHTLTQIEPYISYPPDKLDSWQIDSEKVIFMFIYIPLVLHMILFNQSLRRLP